MFAKVFAIDAGLLPEDPRFRRLRRMVSLEVGMIAGVVLGPSLLGLLMPDLQAAIFPKETKNILYVGAQLGVGAVLGRRVWDRQHRFRIHIGPLRVADYLRFLPDGDALDRLVAIVRQYIGFELDWDLRLSLVPEDVPRARLGRGHTRLGWTSWMGGKAAEGASRRSAELILEPEMILKTRRMEAPDADPALASAYA